ncbi:hypothetical protein BDV96DRAFT_141496 [Lophiotrema nucula]|uniref:DUF7730 domain-containing protein n=1 Tax=Lophiotrema nucula TaxID=690887 RepID=A0A6A5ZS25_9PLEO|nr:hypothetical protein BDV96DRAFT_141496 [Lophiotrema nucula]
MVVIKTENNKRRVRKVANGLMKIPGCGCLLAVVAIPVVFFTCWLWAREEENERRQTIEDARKFKEDEARYKFPPPVSQRERALSIEVRREEKASGTVVRRRMRHQTGTGFFRLPWELREQIYKDYFESDDEILVFLRDRRMLTAWVIRHEDGGGKWKPERRADMLNFLITCRKIYTEGISLLYSFPKLTFIDPVSFLAFSHHILPTRLSSIRNVRLEFLGVPGRQVLEAINGDMDGYRALDGYRLDLKVTYRDLHESHTQHFYNNPSYKEASLKTSNDDGMSEMFSLRRKHTEQTFWTATSRVLSKMESLRNLDILIRKNTFNTDRKITRPLEQARFRNLKHFQLHVASRPIPRRPGWHDDHDWQIEEWKQVVNEDGRFFGWDNDPETVRRAERWRDDRERLHQLQEDLGSKTESGHHIS